MHELIYFSTGLIVGVMNGVAGGGMLIGFPVLIALGLPAISANATGFVATLPGQIASAVGYRNQLRQVPKRYALLLIPSFLGAIIGTFILRHTHPENFANLVPFLILVAIAMLAFQPTLHRYIKKHLKNHNTIRTRALVLMSIMLFVICIYGGYFSPGFGFILLALIGLTQFHHLHQMNGIKNVLAIVTLSASILMLSGSDLIDWHAGIIMGVGSVIGGYFGAHYIQKVSGRLSRLIVICVGLLASLYLAIG